MKFAFVTASDDDESVSGPRLPLKVLCGPTYEYWPEFSGMSVVRVDSELTFARHEKDGVAWIILNEPQESLELSTIRCYRKLLGILRDEGLPHLARVWNVIPRINEVENDWERYRIFCASRRRAFDEEELNPSNYPTASAVGSRQETLAFAMFGSKDRSLPISSPLQREAYHYPKQHGPVSPSFARASVHGRRFFISGTAAIRDHHSLHPGNVCAQTRVTLENLRAVCDRAGETLGVSQVFEKIAWRVYVRREEDLRDIRSVIQLSGIVLGAVVFLNADICRQELLIEIEGAYHGLPDC